MATRTWQLETVLIDSDVMLETVTDVGDGAFALKYRRRVFVFDLSLAMVVVGLGRESFGVLTFINYMIRDAEKSNNRFTPGGWYRQSP